MDYTPGRDTTPLGVALDALPDDLASDLLAYAHKVGPRLGSDEPLWFVIGAATTVAAGTQKLLANTEQLNLEVRQEIVDAAKGVVVGKQLLASGTQVIELLDKRAKPLMFIAYGVGAFLALCVVGLIFGAFKVGVAYAGPMTVCGIVKTQYYDAARGRNVAAKDFLRRDLAAHGCK